MATINYYPNKGKGVSKIYVRLKIGRNKVDLRQSTMLTIEDATLWKSETQLAKGKTANIKKLNQRLRKLRTVIENEIYDVEKDGDRSFSDIDGKWLKKIILKFNNEEPQSEDEGLVNFADNFAKGLENSTYKRNGVQYKYSQNTINKYTNFVKQLKDFENSQHGKFKCSDVDESFAYSFLEHLGDVKGLSVNTKGRYVKRLKTILKQAEVNGMKVNPKYNLIKGFEGENIVTFLTFEELERVIETPMPSERMGIARDWFIIASYTAQRISDLFRFTEKNIQTIEGGRYIVFKQFKTGAYVEVPIHYHVENILKKYQGKLPPRFTDNEQSNRSILSQLIKDVCKEANINEIVRGRFNGKIDNYPKHKLISNHTGRRSFCSNFYGQDGWTIPVIMNISGHINESNFYKYIDKEDKTHSRNARALFDKMKVKSNEKQNQTLRKVN